MALNDPLSSSSENNYHVFADYGHPSARDIDPYYRCLLKDGFLTENGQTFGPESDSCFETLTERCGKLAKQNTTDDVCMRYFQNQYNKHPDRYSAEETVDGPYPFRTTVGDQALRKAGEKAFCRVVGDPDDPESCGKITRKFDYQMSESPEYTINFGSGCRVVCDQWTPKMTVNNPVLEMMLDKPELNNEILDNICSQAKRQRTNITGKRLREYCNQVYPGEFSPPVEPVSVRSDPPTPPPEQNNSVGIFLFVLVIVVFMALLYTYSG